MSNNAQAHAYINSSVDYKHKGLETFYLYILVENLQAIFLLLVLGNNM